MGSSPEQQNATELNTKQQGSKIWSSPENWKERIYIPTLLAGAVGGGLGLVSKHRKTHGVANMSATYATNLAIVAGCYCGAREFVRASRDSAPDDLLNSAIGGFASGALLGRLQGGQLGAIKYSVIFAIAGTAVDFASLQLLPHLQRLKESILGGGEKQKSDWFKMPEWSPIQVLDEEALAAKRAREQQLLVQSTPGNLNGEES